MEGIKSSVLTSVSGLKCDNPECDYRDDSIPYEEYESYIDAPCPECGASLLTQDDYNLAKAFIMAMTILPTSEGDGTGETYKVSMELNGTGSFEIKAEKL